MRVIQFADDRRPTLRCVHEVGLVTEHHLMKFTDIHGARITSFVECMNLTIGQHLFHLDFEGKVSRRPNTVNQTISTRLQSIRIANPFASIAHGTDAARVRTVKIRFPVRQEIVRIRTSDHVLLVLIVIDKFAFVPGRIWFTNKAIAVWHRLTTCIPRADWLLRLLLRVWVIHPDKDKSHGNQKHQTITRIHDE